jgi:hypothetical protein
MIVGSFGVAHRYKPSPEASPSSPEATDVPPDHGPLGIKEVVDPEIIALLKNSALKR